MTRTPGEPPTIVLLREDGSGERYVTPTRASKDPKTNKIREKDWSVGLPATFWTNGWALALSTPGLAMLLVMLDLYRPTEGATWITPDRARSRYGLSEDTWTRGVAELKAHGLISVGKQPVSRELSWSRVRNKYTLKTARLRTQPLWADDGEEAA